jgi:tRNA(Ile)-lysidine synthase
VTDPVTARDYPAGGGRGTARPARAREAVRRAIRTAAIRVPDVFAPGSRLVVAFSGGQDSTCLLHALAHAHRKLELVAVHVDHGLRPESAEEAERARQFAAHVGVTAQVVRVDIRRHRGSVEQAARTARYAALTEAADAHQAKAIVVGHTADDQAETVLLNLLRGSGLLGLAAMRMDERRLNGTLRVVRPLLGVARSTTLAYCQHFGLHLVEDASNQTRAYTRNRVRLDLLPLLEQFNPGIRIVLARAADLAVEDNAVLEALMADLDPRLRREQEYDLRGFRAQPRALQRRLLRLWLAAMVGGLVDVPDAPIEDALDVLQTGQPNQAYHLPYGVELCVGLESFSLRSESRARQRKREKNWDVTVPRV